MRQIGYVSFLFLSLLFTTYVNAKRLWSDNSFSYLKGSHYRVGDSDRTVITYEHVSGHTWGDVFLFVDRLKSSDGENETYMEISPRFKINRLVGLSDDSGFIKNTYIAVTAEIGESSASSFDNYLLGVGFDFNVPGFAYFQWNVYRRNNDKRDNNWQLTQVWGLPFHMGSERFLYDGFIDWSSSTDDMSASLNFTSQLKWDLGKFIWQEEKKLYLGIEYVYWRNKFGIRNSPFFKTNESNVNFLLKAHF